MRRKVVSGLVLTTLVVSIWTMTLNIQVLKASGTIYIRPDGSIEGTDRIERDGNLYTFIGDIDDEIVVERDDIVVDGANYTLEGIGSGIGIDLLGRESITIKNIEISLFDVGIHLENCCFCTVSGTKIGITFECGIELAARAEGGEV